MGGRLQVFVMVMVISFLGNPAIAKKPSKSYFDWMKLLASRCLSEGIGEAAADLTNLPPDVNCVALEHLYADAVQYNERDDMTGFIIKTCRDKDNLLLCSRQRLQRIERCLLPQEKYFVETNERIMENAVHYFCRNIDDIASLLDSTAADKCTVNVEKTVENCTTHKLGNLDGDRHFETFEELLDSMEGVCPIIENTMQCVKELANRCQDAISLRLFNSFIEEVVWDGLSCPKKRSTSGAVGLQAFTVALSGILGHLVLGLVALQVLHLH